MKLINIKTEIKQILLKTPFGLDEDIKKLS